MSARSFTLFMTVLFIPAFVAAQIKQPVKWEFSWVQASDTQVLVTFTATIDNGWHIYSQFQEKGDAMPTKFIFEQSQNFDLIDEVEENTEPVEKTDPTFHIPVVWFEKSAVFTQRIQLNVPVTSVKCKVLYMVCSDMECLVPQEKEFSIDVTQRRPAEKSKTIKKESSIKDAEETSRRSTVNDTSAIDTLHLKKSQTTVSRIQSEALEKTDEQYSPWTAFILGLAGGFIALLMPCIFPMIPFTISYFFRTTGSQRKQIWMAVLYGVSIIVIYVSLGLTITLLFGADALNALSTNGLINFGLFLLLIIFAFSLLGGFELTLPSSWINKADAQSGRQGFAGIFFMAATLALVSFSCTGPIIGTLLVKTYEMGFFFPGPVVGMLGFSLALALPFTLFAIFPSWLKKLPKSGGWLNAVKVVLGFLELALALKFLSTVDLAYHWDWFDREVFLVLWIIIFCLMGFYLLGKIRLPHDGELTHLSPLRLFLAIVTLAFTLYMIPGLWGAPLKVIAAFLPPQHSQDFDLYTAGSFSRSNSTSNTSDKKYSEIFRAPHNLEAFFDYDEGMEHARKTGKPVLLDFTGHGCVNCRKMEATVWPEPSVLREIRDNFVLIQLYVDDKTELPKNEQTLSSFTGRKMRTIGNKWSAFQAEKFRANSQPYYVLLSPNGDELVPPRGADYDADKFLLFLQQGRQAIEPSTHTQ